jgi:SAM-dependent methyltransferase
MTIHAVSDQVPLRIGPTEAFRRMASFLHEAGFDEGGICRTLGVSDMGQVGAALIDPGRLADAAPRIALLINLFLGDEPQPVSEVERLIDPGALQALLELDVLRRTRGADAAEVYAASVLLYPVAGFFVVSDRGASFEEFTSAALPDVVFPALFGGTLRFLRVLPRTPVEDVLDLCAGSGIAALVLSRKARRAVAADITARAVHFARFNAQLNECANVEAAQGDLYDAVHGRTFDLIVAHPPYIPAESVRQIYRDGGLTGEGIIQRIVQALPRYLRPGGALHMMCAAWDAEDASFEDRARTWLGATHPEFDIVFAMHQSTPVAEVVKALAARDRDAGHTRETDWTEAFARARLAQQVYGALVIERHRENGSEPLTRRCRLTDATDGAAFSWLLGRVRWLERLKASGMLTPILLQSHPRFAPAATLNVVYGMETGVLAPQRVVLQTDQPFGAVTRLDPWMLGLLTRLDGERSLEAVYASVRDAGRAPAEFRPEHLAMMVAMGLERAFFEADVGRAGEAGQRTL